MSSRKILVTGTVEFIGSHLANRISDNIRDVQEKVFTRDIFESDS